METRTEQAQSKSRQILLSAGRLLANEPVDRVRMEGVAAKARVSKATLYKYYRSKEDLVKAVVDSDVKHRIAIWEGLPGSSGSFIDKMRWIVAAEFKRTLKPGYDRIDALIESDELASARLFGTQELVLCQLLDQGIREGYLDPKLEYSVFYWHWELYRAGLRAKVSILETSRNDEELIQALTDAFLYGITVSYAEA